MSRIKINHTKNPNLLVSGLIMFFTRNWDNECNPTVLFVYLSFSCYSGYHSLVKVLCNDVGLVVYEYKGIDSLFRFGF